MTLYLERASLSAEGWPAFQMGGFNKQGVILLKHKIGILCSCFVMMSYLAVSPVIADIAEEFSDVNISTVQMVITLPSLVCLATSLLAGVLARRFYKRTIILISMGCYVAGGLCPLLLNGSIAPLLICSAVLGLGTGGMVTATAAIICDCYRDAERSQMMGLQAAMIGAGGMVFTLLGGWLSQFGWRTAYGAFFLLIPCFVIAVFCLPKGTLDAQEDSRGRVHISSYVWIMSLMGFLFYALQNTFNTNISLYMVETGLGTAQTAGLATSLNTFAGLIAGCLMSRIMARLKQYIVPAAFFLAVVGLLLTWLGESVMVILVGGVLIGFGFSTYTPAGSCLVSERVEGAGRSLSLALLSAGNNLGAALSPALVNTLSAQFDQTVRTKFFIAAAALLIVTTAAGVWLRQSKPPAEEAA